MKKLNCGNLVSMRVGGLHSVAASPPLQRPRAFADFQRTPFFFGESGFCSAWTCAVVRLQPAQNRGTDRGTNRGKVRRMGFVSRSPLVPRLEARANGGHAEHVQCRTRPIVQFAIPSDRLNTQNLHIGVIGREVIECRDSRQTFFGLPAINTKKVTDDTHSPMKTRSLQKCAFIGEMRFACVTSESKQFEASD